jgi:hypothetical protein
VPVGYRQKSSTIFNTRWISEDRPYDALIPKYPTENEEELKKFISTLKGFENTDCKENWAVCLYHLFTKSKEKTGPDSQGGTSQIDPILFMNETLKAVFEVNETKIIDNLLQEPISKYFKTALGNITMKVSISQGTLTSTTLHELQMVAVLIIILEKVQSKIDNGEDTLKKLRELFYEMFKSIFKFNVRPVSETQQIEAKDSNKSFDNSSSPFNK